MKEQYLCLTCKFKESKVEKLGPDILGMTDVCEKGIDIGGMGFPTECSMYKEKDITLVLKDFADAVQKISKID
jgi:hypothetical protein